MVDSEKNGKNLQEEIHQQARAQAAKGVIAGLLILLVIAASGWWFYLKPKIVELAGGVPSGAVLPFDSPSKCPGGWSPFDDGAGRVIIGTGTGNSLTERQYRETGGAETHTLKLAEIPSHSHSTEHMVYDNNKDGVDSITTKSYEHHIEARNTGSAGGGAPHNNMPPYLVLKLCKKN